MPYGTVKEIKGKTAVVILERQDMCGDCHACEMISGKKACTLNCQTRVPCEVGDRVEVSITNEYFLKATYLVYGVPLVGFLMGLLVGILFTKGMTSSYEDLVITLTTIIGTALGVGYIRFKDKKEAYHKFLPYVIGKEESKIGK